MTAQSFVGQKGTVGAKPSLRRLRAEDPALPAHAQSDENESDEATQRLEWLAFKKLTRAAKTATAAAQVSLCGVLIEGNSCSLGESSRHEKTCFFK